MIFLQVHGHLKSMYSLLCRSTQTENDENRLQEEANDPYSLAEVFLQCSFLFR